MDYGAILKRSLAITLRNKYLWIFAIFAGGIGGSWGSFSGPGSEDWGSSFNTQTDNLWANFGGVIIAIMLILLILGFLWIIFSIICQGAILGSVEKIENNQKSNFWLGLRFGLSKFWRVLGVATLMFLIALLSLAVLVIPIVLFVVGQIYALAIIYGILMFIACLALWIYLGIMYPYVQRIAVLGNIGSWRAYEDSWNFFKKHYKDILIVYLILIAVGFAIGLGMILGILIVGGILAAIGYALYLASMAVFWMYVAVFGFAFIALMLVVGGMINTFTSSIITIVYLKLAKS